MRYLGLDLGTKTLGVAVSDLTNTIATSIGIIRFDNENYKETYKPLKKIIDENKITTIVLGLPKNMNNSIGFRGEATLEYKRMLESWFCISVIMQDERLTTVEATNYMLEANLSRKKRKKSIDALAASIILQTYLDIKRKDEKYGKWGNNDI